MFGWDFRPRFTTQRTNLNQTAPRRSPTSATLAILAVQSGIGPTPRFCCVTANEKDSYLPTATGKWRNCPTRPRSTPHPTGPAPRPRHFPPTRATGRRAAALGFLFAGSTRRPPAARRRESTPTRSPVLILASPVRTRSSRSARAQTEPAATSQISWSCRDDQERAHRRRPETIVDTAAGIPPLPLPPSHLPTLSHGHVLGRWDSCTRVGICDMDMLISLSCN